MISIPAGVLPIAFLPSVGYVAPPPGTSVDHPASVKFYLCFMIGGVYSFALNCLPSTVCPQLFALN